MTAARADRDFLFAFAHLKVIAGRMPAQKPTAAAAAALSDVEDPPQRQGRTGEVIHATSSRLGTSLKSVQTVAAEASAYVSRGGTRGQ